MNRSLLDTSAVSDVIQPARKRTAAVAAHLRQYLRSHGRLTLSEMSCYEILRGLRKKGAISQVQKFEEFCTHCELLPVNYAVLDRAAALWAEGKQSGMTIDDSDLIIAATALVERLPLVTANPRHFSWITGLRVENWRDT